jgi:hypothetical protein
LNPIAAPRLVGHRRAFTHCVCVSDPVELADDALGDVVLYSTPSVNECTRCTTSAKGGGPLIP